MKNKNPLLLKYFAIVGTIVIVFLAISLSVVSIIKATMKKIPAQTFENPITGEFEEIVQNEENKEEDKKVFATPDKTNFLVVGTDNTNNLTDIIMVGTFDSKSKKFEIINIPRDTYTKLSNGVVTKMNAIYNRSNFGIKGLEEEVEKLLNIEIDYHAVIDTKAFREIVEIVGGIYYPLKRDYYYSDPIQGLYINLKAGTEWLNGEQAEQFMRYRDDYIGGDLERIQVQQDFLKEFFRQVVNKDAIMNNALGYLKTVLTYVDTNFGIDDAPMYIQYLKDIEGENINFTTLPGKSEKPDETWYFFSNDIEIAELVNRVFYSEYKTEAEYAEYSSKQLNIQILNGSNTNKLASKKRDSLKINGYSNVEIGTYSGDKKLSTRINVKQKGKGQDLLDFFPKAIINVDANMPSGVDIIVILGTEED